MRAAMASIIHGWLNILSRFTGDRIEVPLGRLLRGLGFRFDSHRIIDRIHALFRACDKERTLKLTKAERAARQAMKQAQPPAVKEPKSAKPIEQAPEPRPRPALAEVPVERWRGCYDESWRGYITPESFAHPAKAGRALLAQIYDRLFKMGALVVGSTVVDPFGGIGTTGIMGAWRGVRVICHELEPKFVALAQSNFDLHREKWEVLQHPIPRIVQGDSRKLRHSLSNVSAIVTSPPYVSGGHHRDVFDAWNVNSRGQGITKDDAGYGDSRGQLGQMKEGDVDAVVSSPPYNLPMSQDHNGSRGGERGISPSEPGAFVKYGNEPGQLDGMPMGDVDAVVSSPPYSAIASGAGGLNTLPSRNPDEQTGRTLGASQDTDQRYGDEVGQLAKLPEGHVDAVVSSPPYMNDALGHSRGIAADITPTVKNEQAQVVATEYGREPGQLDQLETGSVDAVISSPPFQETLNRAGEWHKSLDPSKSAYPQQRSDEYVERMRSTEHYGNEPGQLGTMDAGQVDAVISSPPYEAAISERGGRQGDIEPRINPATGQPFPQEHDLKPYGDTPGQLGSLPSKGVDAIISSPPYENSINTDNKGGIDWDKTFDGKDHRGEGVGSQGARNECYGDTPGQLGSMPTEGVDAIVSSPPFGSGDSASAQSMTTRTDKSAEWVKENCVSAATEGYGTDPGQLAQMPMDDTVDAVLTSPPYGDAGLGGSAQSEGPNGRPTENKGASQPLDQYGTSEGQLNHANEETFWSAARDIVRECHAILKPGGVAVWIVKAFVRDKQIVDFPGDWRRLCEYVGFETVTEVHAMLVKETEYTDIFGEDRVDKKERKSFFRRLAESKGSPKIDHEVVYIMRKQ